MLTMFVQIANGPVAETTTHGWENAAQAVVYWRTLSAFKAYRNGRQTVNSDGVVTRVWFA